MEYWHVGLKLKFWDSKSSFKSLKFVTAHNNFILQSLINLVNNIIN